MSVEHVQGRKTTTKRPTEKTPADLPKKDVDEEQIKKDIDDLLDEIDEVLVDNAEEWIRGFVQKGGQVTCLLEGEWDIPFPHEKMPRLW